MSGQGPPGGGGFNPGAFEFRPGASQFQPRGQGQPQGPGGQGGPHQGFMNDPYAQYGQQGYYPQQGQYGGYGGYAAGAGGGYSQYGGQGYAPPPQAAPQAQQQQAFVPGQRSVFVPSQSQQPRQVQGFQPPSFEKSSTPPPKQDGGKPVSLSIGGGGAAPKAAPSLSIGGAPKAAPSLSIGGAAKAAPSLSIGKKETKEAPKEKEEPKVEKVPDVVEKKEAPKEVAKDAPKDDWDEETKPAAAVPTIVAQDSGRATPVEKVAEQPKPSASGTSTPGATNFSRVVAKGDAESILKEQNAAGAEAVEALYGEDATANYKAHLNIIFAGHVDSGKSSMGGQLMVLTGQVDKRTLEKYQQEAASAGKDSWYLSYVLDSGKDERSSGKTIEVGRASFVTDKRRYTILDAPGHSSFVPNMISGAAQADVAILVLSARKGEFEAGFDREGASREHAVLLRNNGVSKLICAVNKMDEPTVNWDRTRFDEIVEKISPFLKSIGFNPKKDVSFIPVSAQIGQNLLEPVGKKIAPWYEGPSLLEYLDNMDIVERNINAPFLMPITERYNELGPVTLGKVEAGRLRKGDSLLLSPNKTVVEVGAILNEQSEELDGAFCGDNIRLRLKGVTDEELSPGFVLSSTKNPVSVTTVFRADISILETRNIIAAGMSCVLHIHALAVECTIAQLLHYLDKKTRRRSKKPPAFGKQGMVITVLIETSVPICVETFETSKTLGRFTLRDQSKTFAIGKVTKIMQKDQMPDVAGLKVTA